MEFEADIPVKDYFKTMADMMIFCASLAVSLAFWVVSLAASSYHGTLRPVSPWRCLFSVLVPLILTIRATRNKSLDRSGAMGGMLVGFTLSMANLSFFSALLAFFMTTYKLARWKAEVSKQTDAEHKGSRMGLLQVFCIGGIPTELALFYMIETGPREAPLDFVGQYTATWICLSLLGALACSAGNVWASEVGPVLSATPPRLITSWKEVPVGTHGGVTPVGLAASFLGGMTLGVAYFVSQLLFASDLNLAAPQWPVVMYGGVAGLTGSLLRSYLGARAQYSGYDVKTGEVVSYESRTTKRISGKPILEDNSASLFSAILIAWLLPGMAWGFWPEL
ncbi:transmembrane protein 19-like [Anguilla anguilla]|uniref:transmembrane protein 19-like n=1 Tax=Anguilla anguilla TaxID=7936 RepID=UPI0015ACD379|nr:transmembrane protein 19-like [Anguilla anguilla]